MRRYEHLTRRLLISFDCTSALSRFYGLSQRLPNALSLLKSLILFDVIV